MNEYIRELYQEVILDHNKNPKNFKSLGCATHSAEGFNPLCGDKIDLALEIEGDVIKDIGFQGSGCAISKASASVMTSTIKGMTLDQAQGLFKEFQETITSDLNAEIDTEKLGKLAVFAGVREFPARVKCAALAWHTMISALDQGAKEIRTQ